MSIMCLSLNGKSLTPPVGDALLVAARTLYQDRGIVAGVESAHCEGEVRATGKELVYNDTLGQIFEAYLSLGSFMDVAIVSFFVSCDELSAPVYELPDPDDWSTTYEDPEDLPPELLSVGEGGQSFLN